MTRAIEHITITTVTADEVREAADDWLHALGRHPDAERLVDEGIAGVLAALDRSAAAIYL